MNSLSIAQRAQQTISAPRLLQLGFAFCFIGHGMFGLLQKPEWLVYFRLFGIDQTVALHLMPLVGTVDITVGLLALIAPTRLLFLYGAVWAFFTAALRPLAGQGLAEWAERAGNYGVPIALLLMVGAGSWFQRVDLAMVRGRSRALRVAQWSTALLLAGHAVLILQAKPLLLTHLALIGIQPALAPTIGIIELVAAISCLAAPSAPLFVAIALWKLATESLYIFDGAAVWEFVERAGSYAAPLASALLLSRAPALDGVRAMHWLRAAPMLGLLLLPIPIALRAQEPTPGTFTAALLKELQGGGYVVACRHAITSRDREDRSPVNFDDPSTQRVLSREGEEEAAQLGKDLKSLGIPFGVVLASPYQRTRRSAELMAGRVAIDTALSSAAGRRDAELKELITREVPARENRLLVTHQGVLYRVFTTVKQGSIGEGDCLIVKPSAHGFSVLSLVKPPDWLNAAKVPGDASRN